jgi:hypothetical protein
MIPKREIHGRKYNIKVCEGIYCWQEYHKLHSKNIPITYQSVIFKFSAQFGKRDLRSLTPDEILSFS